MIPILPIYLEAGFPDGGLCLTGEQSSLLVLLRMLAVSVFEPRPLPASSNISISLRLDNSIQLEHIIKEVCLFKCCSY